MYGKKYLRVKNRAFDLLGDHCACCGSTDNLRIDRIIHQGPEYTGQVYAAVIANPEAFQILCADCKRWKSDGPICPCSWWDTMSETWRLRADRW